MPGAGSLISAAINYAKTDEARRILETAVHNDDSVLVRAYTLPRGH